MQQKEPELLTGGLAKNPAVQDAAGGLNRPCGRFPSRARHVNLAVNRLETPANSFLAHGASTEAMSSAALEA